MVLGLLGLTMVPVQAFNWKWALGTLVSGGLAAYFGGGYLENSSKADLGVAAGFSLVAAGCLYKLFSRTSDFENGILDHKAKDGRRYLFFLPQTGVTTPIIIPPQSERKTGGNPLRSNQIDLDNASWNITKPGLCETTINGTTYQRMRDSSDMVAFYRVIEGTARTVRCDNNGNDIAQRGHQ
jgi:hypothetical protein